MCALNLICASKHTETARLGSQLLNHVFYEHDQLTMFVTFTKTYAPHLFSKRYALLPLKAVCCYPGVSLGRADR